MDNVFQYGGLLESYLASKLKKFGVDGVLVSQGAKSGVTTQLRENFAPYMLGVHYVTQSINLVVQTLSKLPLVSKIETMLQTNYTYYILFPKRHLKF